MSINYFHWGKGFHSVGTRSPHCLSKGCYKANAEQKLCWSPAFQKFALHHLAFIKDLSKLVTCFCQLKEISREFLLLWKKGEKCLFFSRIKAATRIKAACSPSRESSSTKLFPGKLHSASQHLSTEPPLLWTVFVSTCSSQCILCIRLQDVS